MNDGASNFNIKNSLNRNSKGIVFMKEKTTRQRHLSVRTAALLISASFFWSLSVAYAGDVITAEVLRNKGYRSINSDPQAWAEIMPALYTGQIVASERLKHFGSDGQGDRASVQVFVRQQTAKGSGADALNLPEYYQVVDIPDPKESGGILSFSAPITSEDVERMRRELDPNAPKSITLAKALNVYAFGQLMVGSVIDHEIANSAFATRGYRPRVWTSGGGSSLCDSGALASDQATRLGVHHSMTRFSAQMFFFGPNCMLTAIAERLKDYQGEDLEGEAQKIAQTMESGILDSAVFNGFTQDDPRTAAVWTGSNNQLIQADAYGFDQRGHSSFALWTEPHLNFTQASIGEAMPQGPTTYGSWTIPNTNFTQTSDDGTKTTINTMTLTMDMDWFVIVKQRSEGTIESEGEVREFYMENEMGDFRYVPDSLVYEHHKKVIRMGGMLSPEDRAKMQEAKEKLAEFDRQMASLPKSQQAMMKRMMGSKMDEFRKLADDGTFEMEMITTGWVLNPHLSDADSTSMSPLESAMSQSNIVKIVQEHLVALNYDPGNTTGELTKQTVIAITKYEAAVGMPVTGEATIELIAALEASIAAGR